MIKKPLVLLILLILILTPVFAIEKEVGLLIEHLNPQSPVSCKVKTQDLGDYTRVELELTYQGETKIFNAIVDKKDELSSLESQLNYDIAQFFGSFIKGPKLDTVYKNQLFSTSMMDYELKSGNVITSDNNSVFLVRKVNEDNIRLDRYFSQRVNPFMKLNYKSNNLISIVGFGGLKSAGMDFGFRLAGYYPLYLHFGFEVAYKGSYAVLFGVGYELLLSSLFDSKVQLLNNSRVLAQAEMAFSLKSFHSRYGIFFESSFTRTFGLRLGYVYSTHLASDFNLAVVLSL